MLSINSRPSAEKFHLLNTVWFVIRETKLTSKGGSVHFTGWHELFTTLFGFDSADIYWDEKHYDLICEPTVYKYVDLPLGSIY